MQSEEMASTSAVGGGRATASVRSCAVTQAIAADTVANTLVECVGRADCTRPVMTARRAADWKPVPRTTYATRATARLCRSTVAPRARREAASGAGLAVWMMG